MRKKIRKTRTIVIKIPYEKIRDHLGPFLRNNKIIPQKLWILWNYKKNYFHIRFKNCRDRKKFDRKWKQIYADKIENAKYMMINDLSVFSEADEDTIEKTNSIINDITKEENRLITKELVTIMNMRKFSSYEYSNYIEPEKLLTTFENDYYKAEFLFRMSIKR